MRIGLTYDLRDDYLKKGFSEEETAEFDAVDTIEALEQALRGLGHSPERIGGIQELVPKLAKGQRWDLVFNIAEGMWGLGREAQVPGLLDAYGIPYVFSDAVVLGLALHKGFTKRLVRDAGIATPDFALVSTPAEASQVKLPFPLFAKPVAEGTSKGITGGSLVDSPEALVKTCAALLEQFHQPVLVETFLSGREFTVGMLGTGDDARVLGVMEVGMLEGADAGLYSFHNKENYESLVDYRLAPSDLAEPVAELALRAWRALECRDGGRVDIRMDHQGQPQFLEVNPLAGLHPVRSDIVILNRLLGGDYQTLIGEILASAIKRRPKSSKARKGKTGKSTSAMVSIPREESHAAPH